MNQQRSQDDGGPRVPCAPLYTFACALSRRFFERRYGLVIDNEPMKSLKGPLLVLSNHESNYDFLIAASALLPIKLNFMVTTYFFHQRQLKQLLHFMGCIPKRQFLPDVSSIKSVLRVRARGGSVAIFPEGQVCYSGETASIDPGIGKLIKKLEVTVVTHTVRGNYLTAPKWANGAKYSGRVSSQVRVLLTPEQVRELSVAEINSRVSQALSYNEFDWQRTARVPFSPDRKADGLETILYRCPSCEHDYSMNADGGSLLCSNCGYRVSFDKFGFFTSESGTTRFDDIPSWYRWEYDCAEQESLADGISLTQPCTLYKTVEGKHGYIVCGTGTMIADAHGIRYEGDRFGDPFTLAAHVEHQSNVTHSADVHAIDIEGDDANYSLAPAERRSMAKFIILY
ncbi:MAG: lysophospholipid acyltransferase family protein, partial [Oscillospiraceae bacterium]